MPDQNGVSNLTSLMGSCSSLSLEGKDPDVELKLELASVEAQYQHLFQELSKMKEEALETTRRRWMEKKSAAH